VRYPPTLDKRYGDEFRKMRAAIQRLQSRTAAIDSGMPLAALPAVIEAGYTSGNPSVYINGSSTLSGPFQYLASYTPTAGDSVLVLPLPYTAGQGVGQYVILGKLS
jgi:hypothetical protein